MFSSEFEMQIFVPYDNLELSARCLDPDRLGNQVWRECLTLLNGGWPNHPASKMWKFESGRYNKAVGLYCLFGLYEISVREGMSHKVWSWIKYFNRYVKAEDAYSIECLRSVDVDLPFWWGRSGILSVHISHRRALLYKNTSYYKKLWPKLRPYKPNRKGSLPYVWPVR